MPEEEGRKRPANKDYTDRPPFWPQAPPPQQQQKAYNSSPRLSSSASPSNRSNNNLEMFVARRQTEESHQQLPREFYSNHTLPPLINLTTFHDPSSATRQRHQSGPSFQLPPLTSLDLRSSRFDTRYRDSLFASNSSSSNRAFSPIPRSSPSFSNTDQASSSRQNMDNLIPSSFPKAGSPSSPAFPSHRSSPSASSHASGNVPRGKQMSNKGEKGEVSPSTRGRKPLLICCHCQTTQTPLWRRDGKGGLLCDACGLFFKVKGRPRPVSLKATSIKPRQKRAKQPPVQHMISHIPHDSRDISTHHFQEVHPRYQEEQRFHEERMQESRFHEERMQEERYHHDHVYNRDHHHHYQHQQQQQQSQHHHRYSPYPLPSEQHRPHLSGYLDHHAAAAARTSHHHHHQSAPPFKNHPESLYDAGPRPLPMERPLHPRSPMQTSYQDEDRGPMNELRPIKHHFPSPQHSPSIDSPRRQHSPHSEH